MKEIHGRNPYMISPSEKILSFIIFTFLLFTVLCNAQDEDPILLNTAANCSYMKDIEKEMICEINLLRNDPPKYVQFLDYYYELAKLNYNHFGKGEKKYSLTTTYEKVNNGQSVKRTDTVWTNEYEEKLHAVETLITELKNLKPLPVLQPDEGIYRAAEKHGHDQDRHNWSLGHIGSDGSWPWDRIRKFSPSMIDGNENLEGAFPRPSVSEVVIQLLIDDGIPDYGHRENLLNPKWTHVACYTGGLKAGMYQWIQDFGERRKN